MSSRSDGIFVPYRVIFITVIVSVCINIFFLLMGILIGKDDLAWEEQQTATPETPVETRLRDHGQLENNGLARERIEREMANFDDDAVTAESVDVSADEPYQPVPVDEPALADPPPREKEVVKNDPPPKKDPEPVKQTAPKANTSGEQFWIQLTATGDKKKAADFRDKVKKNGYAAVMIQEGGMYKIQVGPFGSRKDAESDRKKINDAFKINSWIRTR